MRSVRVAALLAASLLSSTAHAQYSDGKIKIGVLTDLSGQLSDNTGAGSVGAAELAIEDAGKAINGTAIELVSADHQNKADIGANQARKWFDVDQVDIIVDLPNSAVALAVQEIARDKHKIDLVSSAASSDLTGKACSPTGAHWTYDTYSLAQVTGSAMASLGYKSWFFLTSDYAFGHALERDTTAVVERAGGQAVGRVRMPANTADYSSFLLQAQSSKADSVALATAGTDTSTAIKQAAEFGLAVSGKKMVSLLMAINEVHALGLPTAKGIALTSAFYWDLDDETRAFAKRFQARRNAMPSMYQAGVYSAVAHYLKAVKAASTDAPDPVMAKMRELPINDFMTKNGTLREDGRVIRDMYLFEVKAPNESRGAWDYYKLVKMIPGKDAYRPLSASECPTIKK